jgi:hypothetical protein
MPTLGLSLSSASAVTNILQSLTPLSPLGFPLRIKVTSSDFGITDNLIKTEDNSSYVVYSGSNVALIWGKISSENYGTIITEGDITSAYSSWTAGATTIPRTGWQDGYVVSEANPLSVIITATTPQTFTYNASVPSIAFSNNQSLDNNYFFFNPSIFASAGTRSTTISLVDDADYVASNSPSVSYTINKKNVTIALTNQSSTYAPNQVYSAFTPVAVTGLAGSDTVSGSFGSLLTGMPATGANAGSYTLSLNPSYTSTNYTITNTPVSVTWTISKANQTITFSPVLTGTNGQTQTLSASSTSGLAVTYSVVSGPATLNGSTLTYTGTGDVVVRASQAGGTNYNAATNVDRTIAVSAPAVSVAGFPDSVVMNLERYFSYSATTLVKKSTQGEYLGNSSGSGDTFYLRSGFVYKKVEIYSGIDYGNIYLLPPNSIISGSPTSDDYVNPSPFWRIIEWSSNDGTNGSWFGYNSSTSTTTIPTTGWTPDPAESGNGVTAVSITLPTFPNVSATSELYVNGVGPYTKTTTLPSGYTFSGSGNIYYIYAQPDEEFTTFYWVVFSGSTQGAVGSGALINLQANKWYMFYGIVGENGESLYLDSTNTTTTQTSATFPLSNWSPARTITAPATGIPTATTNTITLQFGNPYISGGYSKQSNGYFGDIGDSKLVWSGTRWEVRGEDYSLTYYNNKPNQTINYFPDQGDWFSWNNNLSPLIFVGGA